MLPRRRVEFLFQETFKGTHCAHILEITILKCFRKDGKDEVSFGDLIQHTDSVCKFINHTENAEFTFPEHASQLLALERECIRMLSCPFINMSDELIMLLERREASCRIALPMNSHLQDDCL